MCVLTFLPTINSGYILTNNRDEALARPKAIPPKKYNINGKQIYFPKDAKAGGTWIATSNDFTVCLLNGAFENHTHTPPYRQSRGQIILDFFNFDTIDNFIGNYAFKNIENFTFVIVHHKEFLKICELRWDGSTLSYISKNPQEPHIWSSATLYPKEIRTKREHWFADFRQQNPNFTREQVVYFHLHGGTGDAHNDMQMNRNGELITQCIFQVVKQNHYLSFSFHDLLAEQELRYRVL
jgi:hypothetical protein